MGAAALRPSSTRRRARQGHQAAGAAAMNGFPDFSYSAEQWDRIAATSLRCAASMTPI